MPYYYLTNSNHYQSTMYSIIAAFLFYFYKTLLNIKFTWNPHANQALSTRSMLCLLSNPRPIYPAIFVIRTARSFPLRSAATIAEERVSRRRNRESDLAKEGCKVSWCPACQAAKRLRYPLSKILVKGTLFSSSFISTNSECQLDSCCLIYFR